MKYNLVIFDIDGTLCPSGRVLNEDELKLIDTTNPKDFKANNLGTSIKYAPFQGVSKVLEELAKSTKLAIASNGPSWRQRNKLTAAGIDHLFDKELIIISEDLALFYHSLDTSLNYWPKDYAKEEYLKRVEKPNSHMLSHLLIRSNVPKQNAIYVGNDEIDLTAAKNAGVHFVRVIDKSKKEFKTEQEIHQNEFHKLISLLS
jgi:FMN phosphatase YigB (HAD superfamily)